MPIRIGINAVLLTGGGAAIALDKLLSQFVRLRPDLEYHVVSDATAPLVCASHPSVFHRVRHSRDGNHAAFAFWHLMGLPIWAARNHIDILFTHTCYLPPSLRIPTVLLMQDARYFYDSTLAVNGSDSAGSGSSLKKSWAYHSIRTARTLTVQSRTLADSIVARIPSVTPRLSVIPHGAGFLDSPPSQTSKMPRRDDTLELLCVSLFRRYKNFSLLLRTLKCLHDSQVRARLHLTLDPSNPEVQHLWNEAQELGIADCLVNNGEVSADKLPELYREAHAFVFASTCESFGFPLIEAMSFGLPVFAIDTSINREICGSAAVYFPPDEPRKLANLLRCYHANPELWLRAAEAGGRRAERFSWAVAGEQTLNLILDQIPNSRAAQ
jgi:glycosyltransferase involved in cell wall biosynthesis